jgi:hypothetical protein
MLYPHTLHRPHACTVQQGCHQIQSAVEITEKPRDLPTIQNHGQALGAFSPSKIIQAFQMSHIPGIRTFPGDSRVTRSQPPGRVTPKRPVYFTMRRESGSQKTPNHKNRRFLQSPNTTNRVKRSIFRRKSIVFLINGLYIMGEVDTSATITPRHPPISVN